MKRALVTAVLAVALCSRAAAQDVSPLVHEGVVDAPVDAEWAAWATSEGLRSWMAPHADIDLRVGGRIRANYNPHGQRDNPERASTSLRQDSVAGNGVRQNGEIMRSAVLLAIVFLGLTAVPARAQASKTSAHEGQDILNYPLTLPRANQLIAAVEAMTKYLVSLPDFQDRLFNSMKMTAAERRAQLEADPKAMAILKAHGLTAQDYLVGVPALRMSLMAAQAPADAPNLAVSPANLAFARANLAQLKPKMDAADGIKTPRK